MTGSVIPLTGKFHKTGQHRKLVEDIVPGNCIEKVEIFIGPV